MSKCQSEGLQAAGLVTRNILAGNRIRTTAPPQEFAASTVNQPASQDGFEPTFFFVTWHILALKGLRKPLASLFAILVGPRHFMETIQALRMLTRLESCPQKLPVATSLLGWKNQKPHIPSSFKTSGGSIPRTLDSSLVKCCCSTFNMSLLVMSLLLASPAFDWFNPVPSTKSMS